MSLRNDYVEGAFTTGDLAVGNIGLIQFDPVDADLAGRARAGDVVSTNANHTLDESLFATAWDKAREFTKPTQNRRRSRFRRSEPAECVIENDDISALNIRRQRVNTRDSNPVILNERVVHGRRGNPEHLHDESTQERGDNEGNDDNHENLA